MWAGTDADILKFKLQAGLKTIPKPIKANLVNPFAFLTMILSVFST